MGLLLRIVSTEYKCRRIHDLVPHAVHVSPGAVASVSLIPLGAIGIIIPSCALGPPRNLGGGDYHEASPLSAKNEIMRLT